MIVTFGSASQHTRQPATCLFSPSTLFWRPIDDDDDDAVLNAFIATRSKVGQLSGFFFVLMTTTTAVVWQFVNNKIRVPVVLEETAINGRSR